MADGVVVHPTDYWAAWDADNAFWERLRVRVVRSVAIAAGTALVGAFASGAQVRRTGEVVIAVTNGQDDGAYLDYFVSNRVAVKASTGVQLATFRPDSFAAVDLAPGAPTRGDRGLLASASTARPGPGPRPNAASRHTWPPVSPASSPAPVPAPPRLVRRPRRPPHPPPLPGAGRPWPWPSGPPTPGDARNGATSSGRPERRAGVVEAGSVVPVALDDLLASHEAERVRRLAALTAAVMAAVVLGMEQWEAWAAELEATDAESTLAALLALDRFPELVDLSGAEAALASAAVDLEALGADQAIAEAEEVTDERPDVAPLLGAFFATAALTSTALWVLDEIRCQVHLGLLVDSVVTTMRSWLSFAVPRTVATEGVRALSTGATAAVLTYDTVDLAWRTEAGPCPICADLAGALIDVGTGIPPAHPNCRCSTVPWPVGDKVPATVGAAA